MKLVKTDLYLLLIDEEAEIKGTVGLCYNSIKNTWDKDIILYQGTMPDYNYIGFQKIIAYRKLNKEAKELDLPLLPPFEGSFNITKWAKEEHKYNHRNIDELSFILGCEVGYEKSQSKQFSLEDMKKAFEAGANWQEGGTILYPDIHGFAQSLSTQQLPKEFEPRMYPKYTQYDGFEEDDEIPVMTPMTSTNSEGKQEIQGRYVY